ncbi:GntR family transcriptional regulator [Halofilum ochraceum]|uniref:GntR family transcriptional regulator n=1 Tax=Halofilum ochraceum TaxID=1611323 RepID=UPI0008D90FE5|nr:GntR family transcriptional regulator [Halofilum ochraceum]
MTIYEREKPSRESLEEQATSILRRRIVEGNIKVGERLLESEAAAEFGISRGTVRVALRRLIDEGLVCHVPYSGYRVYEFSAHDIWEIGTLRSTLEGLGARLAAENLTEDGVIRLGEAFDRILEAAARDEHGTASRLDFELHALIMNGSGNSRLIEHYNRVANQFRMYISMSNQRVSAQVIAESHRALIKAIRDGNGTLAESLVRENIRFHEPK